MPPSVEKSPQCDRCGSENILRWENRASRPKPRRANISLLCVRTAYLGRNYSGVFAVGINVPSTLVFLVYESLTIENITDKLGFLPGVDD